jgi:hypothetical protein
MADRHDAPWRVELIDRDPRPNPPSAAAGTALIAIFLLIPVVRIGH